jgi:hypothetical protein
MIKEIELDEYLDAREWSTPELLRIPYGYSWIHYFKRYDDFYTDIVINGTGIKYFWCKEMRDLKYLARFASQDLFHILENPEKNIERFYEKVKQHNRKTNIKKLAS